MRGEDVIFLYVTQWLENSPGGKTEQFEHHLHTCWMSSMKKGASIPIPILTANTMCVVEEEMWLVHGVELLCLYQDKQFIQREIGQRCVQSLCAKWHNQNLRDTKFFSAVLKLFCEFYDHRTVVCLTCKVASLLDFLFLSQPLGLLFTLSRSSIWLIFLWFYLFLCRISYDFFSLGFFHQLFSEFICFIFIFHITLLHSFILFFSDTSFEIYFDDYGLSQKFEISWLTFLQLSASSEL